MKAAHSRQAKIVDKEIWDIVVLRRPKNADEAVAIINDLLGTDVSKHVSARWYYEHNRARKRALEEAALTQPPQVDVQSLGKLAKLDVDDAAQPLGGDAASARAANETTDSNADAAET